MAFTPGTRLGPYEILSPLGTGGMGEVWKARDTRLDRLVAVKVLPEHLAQNPEALARFEREAKAVAALNHPNILAIHDIGQESNQVTLPEGPGVMEAIAIYEVKEGKIVKVTFITGPRTPGAKL